MTLSWGGVDFQLGGGGSLPPFRGGGVKISLPPSWFARYFRLTQQHWDMRVLARLLTSYFWIIYSTV